MSTFTNLISADQLQALDDCVILDCRAKLGDAEWGHNAFVQGHIAGAIHADLDRDLAAPPSEHGRHPLPDPDVFLTRVKSWGVRDNTQVVAYDDAGGAYAARAWWMLRWIGHTRVAVLDGGMQHWPLPLETGPARRPTGKPVAAAALALRPSLTRLIDVATLMDQMSTDNSPVLLDARAQARWAGREEPIDPIAGHIPGALCMPFQENLNTAGYFKSADALRQRFAEHVQGDVAVVCYCGSGVTAAHNILAMHVAGFAEPALYADSWSGWITDPQRPVETEQ
jgi:thiosulfate/3-mercaptopyruvate sulfurtransferase